MEAVAREPGESFPELMGGESELEAFYRFLNNESVDLQNVLGPHVASTVARCAGEKAVLAIHDTTGLKFAGTSRIGLSRAKKGKQELFAHLSLAVAPGESCIPLGVLAVETWARTGPCKGKRSNKKLLADPARESLRWHRSVEAVEDRLKGYDVDAVHVMDREGDSYALFAMMVEVRRRFVVRLAHDRKLADEMRLFDAVESAQALLGREVRISARKPGRNPRERRLHPARSERTAKLAISAKSVVLTRPESAARTFPKQLSINVVLVQETNPPPGAAPVLWRLVTTEPIDSPEALAAIVDAYRTRWLIEEFFKALKTGCQIERRQLESRKAIEVAMGVFLPIAWRLLLLRAVARRTPKQPNRALTSEQVEVLRACGKAPLKKNPTNHEALMALAALGGHIKNNGDPGWIVLGRAYEKLLLLEAGWRARERSEMCSIVRPGGTSRRRFSSTAWRCVQMRYRSSDVVTDAG